MTERGGYVSLDDIDDELFGEPHRNTIEYLRDRVDRYATRARGIFDDFFSDTREVFEKHNGEKTLRRIRNRIRRTADVFKRDVIRPLRTLEDLQHAKPIMQRYLMANITARALEAEQRIDGYSGSYLNSYPGQSGFNDPDYMRVIDGMVFTEDRFGIITEEGDDAPWVAYQDLNDNTEERDLDIIEQVDILSSWDVLEMLLAKKGKDPTNILNENM